jgi:hypothetical protein
MKYQLRFDDGYTEAVIGEIEVDRVPAGENPNTHNLIRISKVISETIHGFPTWVSALGSLDSGHLQLHTASCCSLVEENA